jgi:hypothetical protein
VLVSGVKAGYYVKEIRYNGIAEDGLVPLDRSALAHSLTILLDDKPASVSGVVMEGDKSVSKPFLLLAKWPPPNGLNLSVQTATGDGQGKFQFSNLPPGEYRVVALRSRDEYTDCPLGAPQRAMAAAKKIELGPQGSQNVTLELTKLR